MIYFHPPKDSSLARWMGALFIVTMLMGMVDAYLAAPILRGPLADIASNKSMVLLGGLMRLLMSIGVVGIAFTFYQMAMTIFGLAGMLQCWLLFRTVLVLRWISALGLIGYFLLLLFISGPLDILGLVNTLTGMGALLYAPGEDIKELKVKMKMKTTVDKLVAAYMDGDNQSKRFPKCRSSKVVKKKQESILHAATRVFIAERYDRSSMDRIAEVADASKRTVYDHFPSKDILFRAVIDRFLRQSHGLKLVPYDSKRSLNSQLNRFADAIVELTRNPQWLGIVKVMTSVIVVQPGLVAESMARVNIKEDSLETWLKNASRDGRLRVQNPGLAAQAF